IRKCLSVLLSVLIALVKLLNHIIIYIISMPKLMIKQMPLRVRRRRTLTIFVSMLSIVALCEVESYFDNATCSVYSRCFAMIVRVRRGFEPDSRSESKG